jgi:superfamily II DNA or RNA helicase
MIIDIHPNFCKVEGTQEELRWLRDLLSFDVPGAKFTKLFQRKIWDGKKKMFNIVSKVFPIGLLSYVCSNSEGQKIEKIDHRVYPKFDKTMPTLNGMELRPYQKDAINKCFDYKNCLIQAATNAGKTVVFSGVIKKIHPIPTLILIHREEILWQIKEVVEELTGLEVGVITSQKGVLIKPVTIAMIPTLLNRLGADQEITDFFESVQCVIVDEVHHAKSKSLQSILSSCKAVYRFGFSGTILAEGTHDGMLIRSWLGSVEFEITNDELISMGVSAKPRVTIHEMDIEPLLGGIFDDAKAILKVKHGEFDGKQLMRKVYDLTIQRGITHNKDRNAKVMETINEHPGKSMLVVVDLLAHGKEIKDLLEANGVDAEFISGASEVRKDALARFKAGDLHVLISTNIIDEGVDISRIEILVMLAGKKSRRQLLQRVGRSLRKKKGKENTVLIVDFMDYGSRHLEKHSKERYNIYKTEKFDIEFRE